MAIYTVVGGALNVRASKSTSSTRLGQLASGTSVDIVRCDNTWSTLQYNGTPAFVMHQYLSGFPDTKGKGLLVNDTAKTNVSGLNVRTGPGLNNPTTGSQLSKGTSVTIYGIGVNSSEGYFWYRINSTSTNPARWVRGDFLAPGGSGGSGGGSSFTAGNFIQVTSNTLNVRRTASANQYGPIGLLRNGTKLICEGTSGAFVKVKWGGAYHPSA